jgi:hypothetical protein
VARAPSWRPTAAEAPGRQLLTRPEAAAAIFGA